MLFDNCTLNSYTIKAFVSVYDLHLCKIGRYKGKFIEPRCLKWTNLQNMSKMQDYYSHGNDIWKCYCFSATLLLFSAITALPKSAIVT